MSPLGRGLFSLVIPFSILGVMGGQQVVLGIAIGVGLLLMAGFFWSVSALRHVKIEASVKGDTTAGEAVDILLSVSGPKDLECAVQVMDSEPMGVRVPAAGSITVEANEMGKFETILVAVQTGVPDGVVGAVDRRAVKLSEPLYVYPAPIVCVVPPAPNTRGAMASDSGELTGLREYTPGDRLRDVHWPAVARTGTVLVRDHRAPSSLGPVTVAFGYTEEFNIALQAGLTRSAVHTLMQRGHQVRLLIGSELAEVRTEVEACRRLAEVAAQLGPVLSGVSGPILSISPDRGASWATRI